MNHLASMYILCLFLSKAHLLFFKKIVCISLQKSHDQSQFPGQKLVEDIL